MIFLAVVLLSALLVLYVWKPFGDTYKGKKLPPGPIRWPVIGSVPQMMMVDKEYPYRQVAGLRRVYGDIMSIGLGVHFAVAISSFEIMKDLLKRPETTLHRFQFQFNDQRTGGENLGIVWSNDDIWTQVRTFTVRKLRDFGFGKTGSIEESTQEEMDALMTHMREESEAGGGVWRVDSNRLSVVPINILWSCVGGYKFDPLSSNIRKHIKINNETFEMLKATNVLSIFPFLKVFPEWSGYNRNGELHRSAQEFMKELIGDAKVRREGRQEAESFIEVFLDEIEKNRGVPGTVMTEKQLVTVLMDLLLAGTDTTSTVMNWVILYFALNQNVQEKVRAEIIKMSGGGTTQIPLTACKKMPYVRACIYETMRLSPFGTIPPPRAASTDIIYGDYVIPKGACILYNLYDVFHEPAYWGDDAEVFRPERFLDDGGAKLDSEKVDRLAQFGFGTERLRVQNELVLRDLKIRNVLVSGKRICPGEAMAMDTLFAFVVSLLSTFSVDVVKGREPSGEPGTPSLTISPQPYVVKLKALQ